MENKKKKRQMLAALVAGFAIFAGFGMIHAGKPIIEHSGSGLIGIGSLYFLIILFRSVLKEESDEVANE